MLTLSISTYLLISIILFLLITDNLSNQYYNRYTKGLLLTLVCMCILWPVLLLLVIFRKDS